MTRTMRSRLAGSAFAAVMAAGLIVGGVGATSGAALGQGFKWPWDEEAPRPRESLRPPPAPIPPPPAPAVPMSPNQAPQGGQWLARAPICVQLEQRLAGERQSGTQAKDQLPRLENEIRQLDRTYQQSESQLQRADCYEYFLFVKSLRNTRQCRDMAQQVEGAKRRLSELDAQRQQIIASSGRSYADEITRELARNNCGAQYQQDASRGGYGGGGSVWQDSEGGGLFGGFGGSGGFGTSQYATYRTVCVRLCDGYYFPVSFATLPQRFAQDGDVCASKCAAPVELYYHPNPGGAMEQAVGARTQEPYTRLKTAFRYRKEFVQGCSCKEAEYVPAAGDGGAGSLAPGPASAPAGAPPAAPSQSRPSAIDRRAERPSWATDTVR